MAQQGFWDDADAAQKTVAELSRLKSIVEPAEALDADASALDELLELTEADDESSLNEVAGEIEQVEQRLETLLTASMLSGPDDAKDVIFTIHPGAGGTDSADWAEMLLRMYERYFERRGWKKEVMDFQPNQEAGVASVVLRVTGTQVFGMLKAERGVHRLIRISPFDKNARRHTAFAAVDAIPEAEEEEIEIRQEDLKIDTYRAGGAGGQHVNVTDSAVRITHEPTGIVVQCQNERSQHRNREKAMKVLSARLANLQRTEREKEMADMYSEKGEISFGGQIRTYTLHPEQRIKDHRTNHETGNVQAVLDGDLDGFIEAWLKSQIGKQKQRK
jgi:peptide chain release factor 2